MKYIVLQLIFQCFWATLAQLDIPRTCIVSRNGTVVNGNADLNLLKKWATEGLEMTNKLRELHGSPPLTLNLDLCRSAQWVADEFLKLKWDNKRRSDFHAEELDPGILMSCGENTWVSQFVDWDKKPVIPASTPLTKWYSEVKQYKFGGPTEGNKTHHFTAMIWKGTTEMCITYAKAPIGKHTYIVAHYYPRANIPLKFRENLQPTDIGFGSGEKSSADSVITFSNLHLPNTGTIIFIVCVHALRN